MKYELINAPNDKYSAKQQILINRGIEEQDINHYMNLTDDDINDPLSFSVNGELVKAAAACFLDHLKINSVICVIVDCDCDGYTSSAILINYISDLKGADWVRNHVMWYLHEGKQHGLSDCLDWIEDMGPDLVIIPDAGSNDVAQLRTLEEEERDVIILDHHEVEELDFWTTEYHSHLYLINSQNPYYPNKDLSGAGVVYQFCRYIDSIKETNYANNYLDLVALGLDGDMMSLHSFETRRLITKGLETDNVKNPLIYSLWQKNKFKLGDTLTAWGATFYIVPAINAITRSGTLEEKKLIFDAMLKFHAFVQVPSTKRGHKVGEMERIVDQAVRTCTNVKNRQSRAEEAGLELVEHLIKDNNMMDHKVLLFQLEPGQVKSEIRGLIANKLMAKYQRPCCMLTKRIDDNSIVTFEGSARGCDKVGINNFKDICSATGVCDYTIGHQGAFGLGLLEENVDSFVEKTDKMLEDMSPEPIYYVDYIWRAQEVDPSAIIDVAEMAPFWGKDMDEALVAIQGLQVTKDMIQMMASNTVKINLPHNVSLIKFRMPDEEYQKLISENGYVEIDAVGTCNINTWNGNRYAQILLTDYQIVGECAYVF